MPFPINRTEQREIKQFLRLTIPLASAQVAQAATGFVDIVMMGWLGQEILAAGGLAATTFTTLIVTISGIVIGISPLIAEAFGANNRVRIQQLIRQGLWLSLIAAIPGMLLLGHMDIIMQYLGQSVEVVTIANTYLEVMVWAFFPALTFAMLKSVVSSLSQPRPITIIVVIGTIFNAVGNYILGFGKLGFPAMGLAGIAWASTFSQWVMLLFIVVYIFRDQQLKKYQVFYKFLQLDLKVIKELISIGVPISMSLAFEFGMFTITTY
ncbi:MAG: MATE family efflux transporter, partial [Coleofasciculaceae cyanobacterium]